MRILFIILAATLPAFAADSDDIGSSRTSRHTLMPIVGYQHLNGEQRGIDWTATILLSQDDGFQDTTLVFHGSGRGEDDFKSPILGLLYRYRVSEKLFAQASAAVIQDRVRYSYPMDIDLFGIFTIRDNLQIQRKNTNWINGGVAYETETPLNWMTLLAQIEVGYAFREIIQETISIQTGRGTLDTKIIEDKSMFSLRGGVDLAIWRSDNMLLQLGISYAQFIPMKSDIDPFGGFGWRFSVFPVWSAK